LLLIVGFLSCKNTGKQKLIAPKKLQIAKHYYHALNSSDANEISTTLGDSITVMESSDNYEERFSKDEYMTWFAWDSVFLPTYKVLEIELQNEIVSTKISKTDKRIAFLHEEPMVWYETLYFKRNNIVKVERTKYEVFHIDKFLKNRENLLNYVGTNHPELSGFLYPQTTSTALKYLKAISLYQGKAGQIDKH